MAIDRTDLLVLKRGSTHYKGSAEDLPRLAIPATRAVLDAAALASGLEVDTIYWITDESRLAIGTAPNAYTAMAKLSEVGGGGGSQEVFVQTTRPVTAGPWTWLEIDGSGNPVDLVFNDGA